MAWNIKDEKCLRCGACVAVCPKASLDLTEHGITNNLEKCILCGICKKMCPVGAIKVEKDD